jgi:hypothetical protein
MALFGEADFPRYLLTHRGSFGSAPSLSTRF